MKCIGIILCLFCALCQAQTPQKIAVIDSLPAGFEDLLAHSSLSHWQGLLAEPYDKPHLRQQLAKNERAQLQKTANQLMHSHWKLVDGILNFDGQGTSLVTKEKYRNFELYLDWLIEKEGDSGVYLRGLPQVQIWDTRSKKLHAHGNQKGSGGLWNNSNSGRFPLVHADNPVGSWNQFFIRMLGDQVTVYLNGQLVVDRQPLQNLWQPGTPLPESEQIELQVHGHQVKWKNIFIKALPSS